MTDSRFFFPLDGPAYKACAGPFFLYSLFFPGEQILQRETYLKKREKFYPCLKILVWKKGDSSFTLNSGAVSGRVLFPIRQSTNPNASKQGEIYGMEKLKKLDRRIWVILLSLVLFI